MKCCDSANSVDKKRHYSYIALATVLFALLLWFGWVLLRWLIAAEGWAILVQDVDHRMKPAKFTDINSDQIRSPREAGDIKPGDFNILFLGDSYVHGFILQYKLAPPAQLEEKLRKHFHRDNINVWNFGWTTSSPILQLRLLKDIGKKYQPDLVMVMVDMSDYRDDYFYRHIIQGDGIYGYAHRYPRLTFLYKQILTELDGLTGWHKRVWGYPARPGYFVATQPLEQNRHLFEELYDSLNQIHRYCQDDLKVPLVVFIPPRHWQYTDKESPHTWEKGSFETLGPYALENYRYFDEKRPGTPYPLISLLEDFKSSKVFPTTFDKDSHWNKHGAGLAADAVFNHLMDRGYLSALGSPATTVLDRHPQ
jgi:hypothetical protein